MRFFIRLNVLSMQAANLRPLSGSSSIRSFMVLLGFLFFNFLFWTAFSSCSGSKGNGKRRQI